MRTGRGFSLQRVSSWAVTLAAVLLVTACATPTRNGINLSVYPALQANLFDCQLRVEGETPNYKLVYTGGAIDVPQNWLRFDKNSPYVEIAVSGNFHTLPVISIRVPYHKDHRVRFQGLWGSLDPLLGPIGGNLPQFQFAQSAEAVSRAMSKALRMTFRLEERIWVGSDQAISVYESAETSYPRLEIWSSFYGSYLQYQCVLP